MAWFTVTSFQLYSKRVFQRSFSSKAFYGEKSIKVQQPRYTD